MVKSSYFINHSFNSTKKVIGFDAWLDTLSFISIKIVQFVFNQAPKGDASQLMMRNILPEYEIAHKYIGI